MTGTVKIPLAGQQKKSTVAIGVAAVVTFIVLWWRQHRNAAAAGAGGTGNIDPATGYVSGSAADQQALAAQQAAQDAAGGLPGLGSGFGGTPFYGVNNTQGTVPPGPGGFVDNAEWAQYAEQYLTQNTGASPAAVSQALGAYISGQPLTAGEIQVVEEAIAFAGRPPVAGAHGDPPGFRTAHKKPPDRDPGSKNVRVPDELHKTYEAAARDLAGHHLRARRGFPDIIIVGAQKPDPGDLVKRNSAVTLYPERRHIGGK